MKLDGDAMWRIDSGWEMRSEVEEQRLRGFFFPLAICVLKPPFHLSAWSEICMQTCMFSFPYKILQCIPHPAFLHSLNLPSLLTSTATICTIKAAARGNQYSKDEANIKNRVRYELGVNCSSPILPISHQKISFTGILQRLCKKQAWQATARFWTATRNLTMRTKMKSICFAE